MGFKDNHHKKTECICFKTPQNKQTNPKLDLSDEHMNEKWTEKPLSNLDL